METTTLERCLSEPRIRGVDVFCGVGGLTRGLEDAGIGMDLGIDIDPACEYPYSENNRANFLRKSVKDVTARELRAAFGNAQLRLLAGCAPCQPFSTYSQGRSSQTDERWNLLSEFQRLVMEARPHLVTMENVPRLGREPLFAEFVAALEEDGFHVFHEVVNCADYGVPQQRKRLVLLASVLGPIRLMRPTTPGSRRITVGQAIGALPAITAGEIHKCDPLHQACKLSPLNLERIRASRPGGTWRDWERRLQATCHRKKAGKSYPSVYGRMVWTEPSPTVTTQFYGFGNGRFGHPEQDRAISLREGAILQSFPENYRFVPKGAPIIRKTVGRLIGNAVPVRLGTEIGNSMVQHVAETVND